MNADCPAWCDPELHTDYRGRTFAGRPCPNIVSHNRHIRIGGDLFLHLSREDEDGVLGEPVCTLSKLGVGPVRDRHPITTETELQALLREPSLLPELRAGLHTAADMLGWKEAAGAG